jgi:hypothetical protein
VDRGESQTLREDGASVPERYDGCRMVTDRTADPPGEASGPASRGEYPGGCERHLLLAFDGMPVARVAEGFSAAQHGP